MTLRQPANGGFASRLALFYGGIGAAIGVQMPFLPVWLAAKGLDSRAIGIVLAAPMIVRLLAVPIATRTADRRDALRETIILAAIASAGGYALVGFADGFWPILLMIAFASAAFTVTMPLADAYALKGLSARKRAYGPVRLWASAAFIAGNLGAGYLVDILPARDLIWVMVAVFIAAATTSLALSPVHVGWSPPSASNVRASSILRSPVFLMVAAAASLIQASHAVYYGFSTLAWSATGLDGLTIGGLWALGVVAEIVLFALSGRLPAMIDPAMLLTLGAAGAALRWAAMALDPPVWALPVLQCLHALSFGATHLGAVQFLARAAPEQLSATAQGYFSVMLGLVMAVAMGLAGILYGAYGSSAYAAMAVAAFVGGLIALAVVRRPGAQG
jgi:MFS transporter, PPP family, 3-phenylpropionic acid transporter